MVHVLESTLEWTQGEVIVNSVIGSHTPSNKHRPSDFSVDLKNIYFYAYSSIPTVLCYNSEDAPSRKLQT
jgi:hypothetical protein